MTASSQPESNENPTTAYEKRYDFFVFFRAVPEAFGDAIFFSLQLQSRTSPSNIIEGSLEAKLPTIWKDGNGTARKKLGRGES